MDHKGSKSLIHLAKQPLRSSKCLILHALKIGTFCIDCTGTPVQAKRLRLLSCSRWFKRPSSGIPAPGSSNPRCWRPGKRGRVSTRGRFSGPRRRLRAATVISRRCNITIVACLRGATRCGPSCTISIVEPRTGQHRRRGFSDGRFPICLRVCYHTSTNCHCQGNVVKPLRQVIEGTECPALNGCPPSARDSSWQRAPDTCGACG
jgi:hypothetical protein